MNKFTNTQKVTITAILVAISIVVSTLAIPIQLGGATTLVITFASPFLITVSILFGPIFGAMAYFANDTISFIIRPLGPYMWEYALLVVSKGFVVGVLYMYIKKVDMTFYKLFFKFINFLGLVLSAILVFVPILSDKHFDVSIYSYIFILCLCCILNLVIINLLSKKYNHLLTDYMQVNFSVALPYIIDTIIATFIFKSYYGLTKDTAFIILVPRILEETFMVIYYSIVVTLFIRIFNNYIKKD